MPGIVPVVKGNGYGFRRWNLMPLAGELANEIAVGTIFEVRDVPTHVTPIVLTPTLTPPPRISPSTQFSQWVARIMSLLSRQQGGVVMSSLSCNHQQ